MILLSCVVDVAHIVSRFCKESRHIERAFDLVHLFNTYTTSAMTSLALFENWIKSKLAYCFKAPLEVWEEAMGGLN